MNSGRSAFTADQDTLTTKLIDLYRNDPDPGIHGAAEWLLRQWGNEDQIQRIDKELGKLALPTLRADRREASSKGNNRRMVRQQPGSDDGHRSRSG